MRFFFRILRIQWHFLGQDDTRSSLEKKFYLKSDWMPPKACGELEKFIGQIQQNFDKWRPRRWIKDNLTVKERRLLKDIKKDKESMYMWEDNGPSFTKMMVGQFIQAGENELQNTPFYDIIQDDPTIEIKRKCIDLVSDMKSKGEISDKVADYLMSGEIKLSNFYHLIKTHSLPNDDTLEAWLEEKGFPIRA